VRARLICVGKPKNPHATALYDDFRDRISRLGLDFSHGWVAEERSGGRYSDDHVMERESRRLLAAVEKGVRLVALDRRGRQLGSEQLAALLQRWTTPAAAFVLGGPLGHHDALLDHADEVWSLGTLTLPHELARVIAAEQLYRAMTLIRGVPYHK
jgi:23S rRNA (pseudouridine1915-N3)-methyltransferase